MVVVALLWSAIYLVWRVGFSWTGVNPLLWFALLLAEAYGWWSLVTLAFFSWTQHSVRRPAVNSTPDVDVYVCTYNEPVDVIRATLTGCRLITFPHVTWLLDDGRRPEMEALANELGARYLTRPDNSHAKAGNINHALGRTDGELVLILDADHVPLPDALDAVVGYFDDPAVALVQTPHDFYNHDSAQHYETGRHEQSVFYEVICPGKDHHGAAFWCGSGAVLRRQALVGVGGVATETIAEDFHTTIKLQRAGWTTRYHAETILQGLAPHDLAGYLLQRDRWARGNLAVFSTPESPLRARELTPRQRFSYFASLTAYLAGPIRLLSLIVLLATLWTGRLPLRATWWTLAMLWLPATVLTLATGSALCRGHMRIREAFHFEVLTMEIHLRALRCILRPGKTTFKVTPKEGIDEGGYSALRQLRLLNLITLLLGIGVAMRLVGLSGESLLPRLPGIAAVVVPILGAIELRRLLRSILYVARRHQTRVDYRFPCDIAATVSTGDQLQAARVQNLSRHGAGLLLTAPLESGTLLSAQLSLPELSGVAAKVTISGTVRSCRPRDGIWQVGVALDELTTEADQAITEYCYIGTTYRRLRGSSLTPVLNAPVPAGAPAPDSPIPALLPFSDTE